MAQEEIPPFKTQPWIVFDSVVAFSFLVGEDRNQFFAIGTNGPAISRAGEMVFFSAGRTRAKNPVYTNMDLDGQLSYGFKVWGAYLLFGFPQVPSQLDFDPATGTAAQLSMPEILTQALTNFSVLDFNLGQEKQTQWPADRFGAGGGLELMGAGGFGGGIDSSQNGVPEGASVLKFPEPIMIPRTTNMDVKMKIAPEVLATIGSNGVGTLGAGAPLSTYSYDFEIPPDPPGAVSLSRTPYMLQMGLIGERVKKTQYGQIPDEW